MILLISSKAVHVEIRKCEYIQELYIRESKTVELIEIPKKNLNSRKKVLRCGVQVMVNRIKNLLSGRIIHSNLDKNKQYGIRTDRRLLCLP